MSETPSPIEAALKKLHIEPNKIQTASINASKTNKNILLLAPTGSGKTLAFLLPLLTFLNPEEKEVQAMIIAPTRELALQIEQVFRSLSSGYKITCCYGGHPVKVEKNSLQASPALIVGTPGRLADHLRRGNINTAAISTLVLDEFDKSLELGFEEEMSFIIEQLGMLKRRTLTSATDLKSEIKVFQGNITFHRLDFLEAKESDRLQVNYLRAEGKDKLELLFRLLCHVGNEPTLVFCNHREAVDRIGELLQEESIDHEIFHGGLKQEYREKTLATLRNGSCRILLSTDLASRGLDIPEIKHVIHYQLATTQEAYIHRNGRTARMFANGYVYLLLSENDTLPPYLGEVPKEIKLPENLSLPEKSKWVTIYVDGGKKDKINKVDIVGVLIQKGGLNKEDIGLIEVQDFVTYVAVDRSKAKKALANLRNEKIKKKTVKIGLTK